MFDENPNLIQGDPGASAWDLQAAATPLVLIHDGGGTIFSYYCLNDVGRPLFGIYNPHYNTQHVWTGGVPEMARHYARLVASVIPRGGSVILGGWSLGGMLSLQVAHELARPANKAKYAIHVQGIVMVDSVCPLILRNPKPQVVPHVIEWSPQTRQETKDAVMRCFDQAFKVIQKWTLPRWADDPKVLTAQKRGEPGVSQSVAGGSGATSAMVVEFDALDEPLPRGPPPPVIMLRATESVPVVSQGEGEGKDGVSRVDVHRQDALLGWAQYREDLIHHVVDIPGHHFNIFATADNLDVVSEKIKIACQDIEEIATGAG